MIRGDRCARLKNGMSICSICDGVGLVRVMNAEGRWVSRPCECQQMQREERRIATARIPQRYRDCTLDAFDPSYPGSDESLRRALLTARKFVDAYPVDTAGKGLLFVGTAGLGKTHGSLEAGKAADLVCHEFEDHRELAYWFGAPKVRWTMKRGEIVWGKA